MTGGARIDLELKRAPLPGAPALLGSAEAPVVRAAAAGAGPILLEGDRIAILGTERSGADVIRIDGRPVAVDVSAGAGTAANVIVGPATLRRELVGPGGSVFETMLALPALPLAVIQWTTPAGSTARRESVVELTLLPGVRNVRYRAERDGVRAAEQDGTDVVDAVVHPPPTEWSIRPEEGGGVRVRTTVDMVEPVTLLVSAGTTDGAERALAAAPHLGSHEIRAAAAADATRVDTLAVDTGVRDLDHGVVWAGARLHAALRRGGHADPEALFWSGVGALAIGDVEGAERVLEGFQERSALGILLAARHALTSGDQGPALARFAALSPEEVDALRTEEPGAWPAWRAALACLADALRHAAPEQELDGLRRAAARPAAPPGRSVRLPMAGAPGEGEGEDVPWPIHLVCRRPGAAPSGTAPEDLAAWADLAAGRADAGYGAWRRALAEGLTTGPGGRGSWDAAPEPWGPGAPRTGILLATLAHGVLGCDPDAPSGRLGLAPLLPRHITAFDARRIRVGDSLVSLEYRREGGVHRFRLEPLGGRVPVMAVLEPSIPAAVLGGAFVDGSPAELDRTVEGDRTRLRVQFSLDAVRTLEVAEG